MTDLSAQIKKLEGWHTQQPLLSLCIGKDGTEAPSRADLLTQFRSVVHTNLFTPQEKIFREGLEKFEKYLSVSFDPRSIRSVALFTDGKGWWEVVEMEFFVEPFCLVGTKPHLDTIKKELGRHKRYLVLLVDKEKARLFTVNQGLIEEEKQIFDQKTHVSFRPKRELSGRTEKTARHLDWHLKRHLREVVAHTKNFVRDKDISLIIIGGPGEIVPLLKEELSYPLTRLPVGEMVTGLSVEMNEIFLKSKEIAAKVNSA